MIVDGKFVTGSEQPAGRPRVDARGDRRAGRQGARRTPEVLTRRAATLPHARLPHRRDRRASVRRWRGTTRAQGATLGLFARREASCARVAASARSRRRGRDVRRRRARRRSAGARAARFHRPLRRAGHRHRQCRRIARHADRRAGRPAASFATCSTPTCSASCTRSRRSCVRCATRAPACWSASRASRASAGLPGSGAYCGIEGRRDHLSREPARRVARTRASRS